MLFVYVAFMGGIVQFYWVFLVDILSSSHSLGNFDMQCRAIFQRYVNLYINRVQDYILSPDCLFRVTHAAAAHGACQESVAITGLPGRRPAVALLWIKFELLFFQGCCNYFFSGLFLSHSFSLNLRFFVCERFFPWV